MGNQKRIAIAEIAMKLVETIDVRLGTVESYLLDRPSSRPYRQPIDAAETFLAEIHDILANLWSDLIWDDEHTDDEEAVCYLLHAIIRLAVGIGCRLKCDLGIDPKSRRALELPEAEGEPWF
jgi:hypothetical protein